MFEHMLNKVLLILWKRRLKDRQRGHKYYSEKMNIPNSWYFTHGIPEAEKTIAELEKEIEDYKRFKSCHHEMLVDNWSIEKQEPLTVDINYKCVHCGWTATIDQKNRDAEQFIQVMGDYKKVEKNLK